MEEAKFEELAREVGRISEEIKDLKERAKNLEDFLKAFVRLLILKTNKNQLEKEFVFKIKNDPKAFKEFIRLLEKNRKNILTSILKMKIFEKCKEIK